MARFYLGPASAIAEGTSVGYDPQGTGRDSVLVVRKDGRLYGYLDRCPHYGDTPMAWRKDAYLNGEGTRIVCAAHGAQFSIESGACTLGPCLGRSLRRVPLAVDADNSIHAELEDV
ncbi:Rieske 2Fe-2S domain-containing protein [Massilia sp. METH4]|uniref:Rieske (2Fe-2S) protein n=1 Tax=Massilia sp. METH4 TaxID=3123041 RepID=UPI0030CC8F35